MESKFRSLNVFLNWYYANCQKNITLVYRGTKEESWARRCMYLDSKYSPKVPYNHRSVLDCEIVIEYDLPNAELNNRLSTKVIERLNHDNIDYMLWSSGNKSSHCLPYNERVLVRVNGEEKIIKIGDIGLGSKNNYEIMGPSGFVRVKHKQIRDVREDEALVKISVEGLRPIVCSQDHRFPVLRGKEELLLEAKDIMKSDKLLLILNKTEGNGVGSYDLGRLLGLFVSDGNFVSDMKAIQFTFDLSEMDYAEFIKKYCEPWGAKVRIKKSPNCIRVSVYSEGIYGLMKDYVVGTCSKNKGFKTTVFGMSKEFRLGVLNGWLEGDGDHRKYNNGESISKGLAKAMSNLCSSLGIRHSLNSYIGNGSRRYRIHIFKNQDKKEYVKIKHKTNNYKKSTYKRLVDIEVDSEDHLFCLANGIVTHNCHFLFKKPGVMNLGLLKTTIMKHYGEFFYDEKNNMIYSSRDKAPDGAQRILPDLRLASNHLIRAEFGVHEKSQKNKTLLKFSKKAPCLSILPQSIWDAYELAQKNSVAIRMGQQTKDLFKSDVVKMLMDTVQFKENMDDGRERIMFALIHVLKPQYKDVDTLADFLYEWYTYSSNQAPQMSYQDVLNKVKYHWSRDYHISESFLKRLIEEISGKTWDEIQAKGQKKLI